MVFISVPSHCGRRGNEQADRAAHQARMREANTNEIKDMTCPGLDTSFQEKAIRKLE